MSKIDTLLYIYIWYTSIANTAMVNLVFNSMMIKIEKNRCGVCGKMVNMLDYGAEFSLPLGQLVVSLSKMLYLHRIFSVGIKNINQWLGLDIYCRLV